jgi:hypothetical protein
VADPNVPTRRGSRAVVVLSVVLALLVLLWCVGTVLLVRFGDELPTPPEPSPSTSTTSD